MSGQKQDALTLVGQKEKSYQLIKDYSLSVVHIGIYTQLMLKLSKYKTFINVQFVNSV